MSTDAQDTAESQAGAALAEPGEQVNAPESLRHDHLPPDRLLLQRGLFAGPTAAINKELYASGTGRVHRERFTLHLDEGASATTNTYFGRFPASYWQRWTTVKEVTVTLSVEVARRARVNLAASDIAGHRRVVQTAELSATGTVTLSGALDMFVDGGALWLEFEALGGHAVVTDVVWTAAAPDHVRPVAIAICTYNRVADCANTVAALASEADVLRAVDAIYVVDQGTELAADHPLFAETAVALGDKLRYLRQGNLGGAGGFTRSLYEVSAVNEHADVVLMDDDILCEPETVLRLNAFANMTVVPTIVGAQMMYLFNPDYLHVSAEEVDLGRLSYGQNVPKSLRNTSMVKKRQERRVDTGYNGWWTCLIPAEVVTQIGLPLPLFIQWDDVEYSVRARKAGFGTVALPNAAVWHADFYWKDFDDWGRYFSVRNSLIACGLHTELDPKVVTRQFLRQLSEHLVAMQYGLVYTTLTAIEDFMRGPEILRDGGIEALAKARGLRAGYPETAVHPVATAPVGADYTIVRAAEDHPSRYLMVLLKRAVYQWTGRAFPGPVAVTREDAHWWHVSLFQEVVVTDSSQAGVRIRRRDKAKGRALFFRTLRVLRRLRRELPGLTEQYRAAVPELIDRENWARLYGIEPKPPAHNL